MSLEMNRGEALCRLHIVDVDESPYQAALRCLSVDGVPAAFYRTASSALRHARECADGIWLIAMKLPDLSGPQLVEMLAGLPGRALIVVMGNAYSMEEEAAALSCGASQYLIKPLAKELCRGLIQSHLGASRACADAPRGRPILSDSPICCERELPPHI